MSSVGERWAALGRRNQVLIALGFSLAVILAGLYYFFSLPRYPKGEAKERELQQLQEAVKSHPQNAGLRVELALAYAERGKFGQAKAQAEQALTLEKDRQDALIVLGNIYMAQKNYTSALTPYLKVVELNKDNPMRHTSRELEAVFYYLGAAYLNLNQPEAAVPQLQEALAIDRTDADAHYLLGRAYQHLAKHQEAVSAFEEAIRFTPSFREAYEGLALSYDRLGAAPQAAYARAMAVYSSGDFFRAAGLLEEVIAAQPDLAEAYLGLGLAYEKLGNTDKAVAAYHKAVEFKQDLWLANARLEALGRR